MTDNIVPSIVKSYQGKNIRIREDKYVCLTDMATASGKQLGGWIRLKGTNEYLEALSEAMQICIGLLLEVENGTTTWAHPDIAIEFAGWCSMPFKIQMNRWINELMATGTVSIAPQPEPVRELPRRDAIEYINATATLATLPDSRIKRLLDARLVAELSIDVVNQRQITPVEDVKNYTTATVRAAMLGYSTKQIGNGSSLGKFIKSEITPDFSDWQGQFSVAHYEVCDALDSRIHAYFLTRSL